LRPLQEAAIGVIQKYDNGILAAGTAFGKTVVAINMIARRKVNTLVLVNRRQLQAQWISKIAAFLNIDEKTIGKIGGGADRWTGRIDVALIQSLSRKGYVDSRVKEYGQIIVDECHAVGAESFEALLDAAPCRYILGLSATVVRNDGHDPLVIMQLGPIRHKVDAKLLATSAPFAHTVYVRQTSFRMRHLREDVEFNYADMIKELTSDDVRNRLIADDVVAAVAEGRSPIILTDRKEQVRVFENLLSGRVKHVVVMTGGMGLKVSRSKLEELKSIKDSEERVIISTGSYIGEGFDDSRMDTLFLATPVSWKGRLTQYSGRLHRLHDGKKEVRIYDYLDSNVAVCEKMFEKRRTGYDAIGYTIMVPKGIADGWPADVVLPVEPKWNERFSASVRRLCRDGVDVALADLFLRATLTLSGDEDQTRVINPKGMVLRFLQERLNTLDVHSGQFKAAVRLPISCGTNPYIEVDLWNDEKKFAVMLDSREELSDVEMYRIARYEDALLYKNGIKVFRCLIGDVCERLDDVLHQIAHLP
jgi:superfamily II DNA or RNA helicase